MQTLIGVFTFGFSRALMAIKRDFDVVGLGLFCVAGTVKTLDVGMAPIPAAPWAPPPRSAAACSVTSSPARPRARASRL